MYFSAPTNFKRILNNDEWLVAEVPDLLFDSFLLLTYRFRCQGQPFIFESDLSSYHYTYGLVTLLGFCRRYGVITILTKSLCCAAKLLFYHYVRFFLPNLPKRCILWVCLSASEMAGKRLWEHLAFQNFLGRPSRPPSTSRPGLAYMYHQYSWYNSDSMGL
jgi:hypothetical protein